MDDLGKALSGSRRKYMLGGGNPAIIPEVAEVWRARMTALLEDGPAFDRILGQYDTPQGRPAFLKAVAGMLRARYGWPVTERNIAVTNGSQTAFYMLFLLLAGETDASLPAARRRVLFPLMPEYIGYRDQALHPDDFVSALPLIERIDDHTHKYHIDFDALEELDSLAAVCVSRPTNPTGNVLTSEELDRLDAFARGRQIPLMIDNAYGTPFPDIIFTDAEPIWNENIILSMSLSKIGLPSLRTGIIVASEEVVEAISGVNAIVGLANGSVGQALTEELFESGEILRLSREVVQPFYRARLDRAREAMRRHFAERFPWSAHLTEGSLFLWIWFEGMPATTMELYERLKKRDVIVVPGGYFSFGLQEPWTHTSECIRVNYALNPDDVERGLEIIAEEVEAIWGSNADRVP
jgi:valine--pyruvate aminotransferase